MEAKDDEEMKHMSFEPISTSSSVFNANSQHRLLQTGAAHPKLVAAAVWNALAILNPLP